MAKGDRQLPLFDMPKPDIDKEPAYSHQPSEISRHLLATSILDRISGPLCETLFVPGVDHLHVKWLVGSLLPG